MRKIAYSLIALAMAAFTFTSCEDVPAPFGQPEDPGSGGGGSEVVEPKGSGTEADPYNVAAAVAATSALPQITSASDANASNSIDAVAVGYVCSIDEIDTSGNYGNATYYISDDKEGKSNKLEIYRGYGLGGQKFNEAGATIIKDGDLVVVSGKLVNFRGTLEFTQGSKILSINGTGGGGGTAPTETLGTKDAPLNIAQALELINKLADKAESEQFAYVKGKVVKVTTNQANFDQYGNLNYLISEDGTDNGSTITVYSGDGLNGAKFSGPGDLAQGDEVIVYGKLYKFVNNSGKVTPEINKGNYLVSLVKGSGGGGGGDTPGGDGSEAKPYTVSQAIAKADQTDVFVKAYIVGWVEGQVYATGAHFDSSSSSATNILIAESASETDPAKCMPVQLPAGDVRTGVNLKDNSGNYQKEILLYGNIATYFGVPGIKSTSYAKIGSNEFGTKPGGGGEPGGGDTGSGYMPVTTIANGNYVFAATADGKIFVATPLETSKTYGYLGKAEATQSGSGIETDAANEFKFTAVDGGYTIQSADGRYLYMKGTYNSFNVDATAPSEGHVWTITFGSDNTVSIKNVLTGKTIQYSTQYNSYGAYTEVTNFLPVLYKK